MKGIKDRRNLILEKGDPVLFWIYGFKKKDEAFGIVEDFDFDKGFVIVNYNGRLINKKSYALIKLPRN